MALPTGGRADPAVGNEALAGSRRSFFLSLVPGARWYPTLKPRLVEHTQTHTPDGFFFWDVSIRNSLRSNDDITTRLLIISCNNIMLTITTALYAGSVVMENRPVDPGSIKGSHRPISFIRIKHRTRANDILCKTEY